MHNAWPAVSYDQIRIICRIQQCSAQFVLIRIPDKPVLAIVQVLHMISVENTVPVATEYLFYPRFYQDTGDRHPCSTCTDHHAAEITHFFPDDFNCVDCSGKRHNDRSMLVDMKYSNLELFPN